MSEIRPSTRRALVRGIGGLVLLSAAGAAAAAEFALDQALARAAEVSGSVRGAALEVEARALQAEALGNLGGPSLSMGGGVARVSNTLGFDTSGIADAVNPALAVVNPLFQNALSPLPDSWSTTRRANVAAAGLSAVWPLYTNGKAEGARKVAAGRVREAEAEQGESREDLVTQVAQRYFGAQLARQVLALRAAATRGVAEHLRDARLLESRGLISRAERLRADVALDDARREEAKAANDLQVAELGLRRQLAQEAPVQASTRLFVHREPPGTLQSFIDAGMQHHPAWQRLRAKREQADASLQALGRPGLPTVVALGNYGIARGQDVSVKPSWQVGVAFTWTLWGQVDHGKLRDAARLEQQRVDVAAEQARRDVPTLIEVQWRAAENARLRYLSGGSAVELAGENLKLQRVAFAQSQSTTAQVIDAELAHAKAALDRQQAAYDYVLALAKLLAACGEAERLPELAASADIQLDPATAGGAAP